MIHSLPLGFFTSVQLSTIQPSAPTTNCHYNSYKKVHRTFITPSIYLLKDGFQSHLPNELGHLYPSVTRVYSPHPPHLSSEELTGCHTNCKYSGSGHAVPLLCNPEPMGSLLTSSTLVIILPLPVASSQSIFLSNMWGAVVLHAW